eukprot:CAMPEP_0177643932 /NCGR_PEP_ID=MMETSP0447-20121125/8413_1 /TAXON_ID=0 /ORGANISM="Stygamoeba regulata, Strain BSH-02190019" /LENGTH=326 /DNA_ID=CAMNT_0019146249 /DNA_START=136 /DNA_END=1113 /DNA_ORIENTATION=+
MFRTSTVYDNILDLNRECKRRFRMYRKHIVPRYMPASRYSFKHFCWAFWTVRSRAFNIAADLNLSKRRHDVMIPFVDFFNHKNIPVLKPPRWFYDESEKCFSVVVGDVKAGSEIFISYGRKPNDALFLTYGFVLPSNHCNTLDLRLRVPEDDPLRKEKLATMEKCLYPLFKPGNRFWYIRVTGSTVGVLYNFFTILIAKRVEELRMRRNMIGMCELAVTVEQREAMFEHMLATLQVWLAKYPLSAEEDVKRLEELVPPPSARAYLEYCSIVLRMSEREMVTECIATVQRDAEQLRKRELQDKSHTLFDSGDAYLEGIKWSDEVFEN